MLFKKITLHDFITCSERNYHRHKRALIRDSAKRLKVMNCRGPHATNKV